MFTKNPSKKSVIGSRLFSLAHCVTISDILGIKGFLNHCVFSTRKKIRNAHVV
jgi:hypothetical protein